MDVQMPELNGHEASKAIRRLERQRQQAPTPVIALTAIVLEADRREALEAKMDGFAIKPINLLELSTEIARLIGQENPHRVSLPAGKPDALSEDVLDFRLVAQLWPDTNVYHRRAEQFLQAPANQPDTLKHQPNPAAAIHRIRGIAGNLGFRQLTATLTELEAALKKQRPVGDPLWQKLAQQFQAASDCLAAQPTGLDTATDNTGPTPVLETASLNALIEQLHHGEIPEQQFARMKPALPADCANAIEQALDNFESDKAAKLLSAYRDTLKEA
jgi:CheY-like chemotaxis protein